MVAFGYGRQGNSQELPSRDLSKGRESEEFHMKTLFARFAKDESGATAIEYGLIATLIAVAIIIGATAVGTQLGTTFNDIAACLGADSGGTCPNGADGTGTGDGTGDGTGTGG